MLLQERGKPVYVASEGIDTDQSVALIVAKVTNDTDRWQVYVTKMSIDTDSDHVSSYGDIVRRAFAMQCYILQPSLQRIIIMGALC